MRILGLLLAASLTLVASENPEELVAKAIDNYRRDAVSALNYTYTATDTNQKGSEVNQVMPLEGTPYERLIAKNGHALTPEEDKRQQEKYNSTASERAAEAPEQRDKRIRKYREQSEFLRDVPEAFDFTLLPSETLFGRVNYVVRCVPKPGYQARDAKGRMFSKLTAKMWIDQEDLRMTKADATITDTMSIGFIMARIAKGGHIELTQTRVGEDVWLPKAIDINGNARILLVDDKKVDEQIVFSGFQPVSRASTKVFARTALQ